MSKSFTERERSIIKQKLIENCKACWNKFGYKKTNVAELCKMSGISTGAFYQFYSSKEMLFIETAQASSNELMELFEEHLKNSPDKHGIALGFKAVIRQIKKMEWFLTLSEEWSLLVRKLPPEFMEQDYQGDIIRYSILFEKYQLKPKKSLDEVASIIQVISVGVLLQDKLAGKTEEAMDFIIDCVIENLFE